MRKICVVITARASYSRIKTALSAIQKHPELELQLITTGSILIEKYGLVVDQIEKDGFRITARLFNQVEGNTPLVSVKTTGLAMIELATIFDLIKPDAVITIADRYETMATAAAASFMNIPLVHIQGGEVSGNIDDKVRNAITQLADIHFVASENAKAQVCRMQTRSDNVYNTGCPSVDIASNVQKNPEMDFDPFLLYGGVGPTLDYKNGYLVVMQHPVTTEYSSSQSQIESTMKAIENVGIPTFWFWPNQDPGTEGIAKGLRISREIDSSKPIHFFKNMEPEHFQKLLKNALCLVGNSSVGIRECSYMGVPVVNIGNRQKGRERGQNVIDTAQDSLAIEDAIRFQITHGHYNPDLIYGDGNSGDKIASLLSTIDF